MLRYLKFQQTHDVVITVFAPIPIGLLTRFFTNNRLPRSLQSQRQLVLHMAMAGDFASLSVAERLWNTDFAAVFLHMANDFASFFWW